MVNPKHIYRSPTVKMGKHYKMIISNRSRSCYRRLHNGKKFILSGITITKMVSPEVHPNIYDIAAKIYTDVWKSIMKTEIFIVNVNIYTILIGKMHMKYIPDNLKMFLTDISQQGWKVR